MNKEEHQLDDGEQEYPEDHENRVELNDKTDTGSAPVVEPRVYKKVDPFEKIRQLRTEKEVQMQQRRIQKQVEFQEREARKQIYTRKRHNDRQKMMQRTKKGQIVMKNVVDKLLTKIKESNSA